MGERKKEEMFQWNDGGLHHKSVVIFFYANIEKGEKNVKIKRESRE